jgi:hypothetical protein
MAGHESAPGEDDVIFEQTVMGDVRMLHEEVMRADDGFLGRPVRAVNGDLFPEDVVVAYPEPGRFA